MSVAPPAPLGAVLWDMDGLLVDTEPLWTVAERELCAAYGVPFRPEVKAAMMGHRIDEAVPILLAATGIPATAAEVSTFLLARTAELFGEGMPLRPGAADLLAALAAAGVPQGLVSSSVRALLDALPDPISRFFAVSVAGDEVALAKPSPEGYRAAAAALGVAPAACVVLEDSLPGLLAGVAAGARVVGVPSVASLPADGRWSLRASLVGLTVADLAALVARPAAPASPAPA